jgi:hypothetical protein
MDLDVSTVLDEVRTQLDAAGGFTIGMYSIADPTDWDGFDPTSDGIDSCSAVVRIATYCEGVDLPYDGIDVPVETHTDGTVHVAGWYELDSPDFQGGTEAEITEWVSKHGVCVVL